MIRSHPRLSVATAVYLAIVAMITLGPAPPSDSEGWLFDILRVLGRSETTRWITYQRVEFTANIFMFFPIGMLARLLLPSGRRHGLVSIAFGVALTCTIEFVQKFIPGRVSDISDIVSNSIGTVLGVAIVTACALRRRHRHLPLLRPRQQPANSVKSRN